MGFVGLDRQKILLLSGTEAKTSSLLAMLNKQGDVRVVDSAQEAIEAIQAGQVDVVVSEAGDFLPGQCEQCARWVRQALGTSGEGVAAIGPEGEVRWVDAVLQAMPQGVLDAVVSACTDLAGQWRDVGGKNGTYKRTVQRLTVADEAGDEKDYELAVSPVLGADGRLTQMAAVVRDVTTTVRSRRRLQSVERAGQQLVWLDAEQFAGLDAPQRVEKIGAQIASHAHHLMNFERFSIRLLDRQTGELNVAMAQGMSECVWHRQMKPALEGQGICGFVAATGRSYLCPDTSQDPRYLEGIGNAGSSLTAPLRLHGEMVGVFNVESDRVGAFDDIDRQMLETFGRYVAMALKILDLLVVERFQSTGQVADDVSSEIAGPLNDIMSDASALLSEYIGDETLQARLEAITKNVSRIRESVKEVAQPTNGLRGQRNGRKRPDPMLAGKRLLVADDEDAIRETLYEVLHNEGCEVDTACDGAQATGMLSRHRYDLVLADICMPHKNGYEVFATVKERNPDCGVILITGFGYDPNHSVVRANQEGLAAVLFKPFKVDQLLTEVRQALGRPAGK